MTRNLRAFGLALVAMLAFAGMAAQAASAVVEHSFNSAVEKTVLTGQTESYSNAEHKSMETFTATAGLTVECYGTYEQTENKAVLDQITVHPKYSTCKNNVVVDTNGCNYIFDSDTTTSPNHFSAEEHAAVSLECEPDHWIEITRPGCWITFSDSSSSSSVNQSLHGVTYKNLPSHSGKHALTVTATVRTIHYEVTPGSFCGLVGHAAGTYTNGKLDGKVEVTGYKDTGVKSGSTTEGHVWNSHSPENQVDITISTPE